MAFNSRQALCQLADLSFQKADHRNIRRLGQVLASLVLHYQVAEFNLPNCWSQYALTAVPCPAASESSSVEEHENEGRQQWVRSKQSCLYYLSRCHSDLLSVYEGRANRLVPMHGDSQDSGI